MLFIISATFTLNIIFYVNVNKKHMNEDYIAQEKLVSICMYLHSTLEIMFNIVLLSFLLLQSHRQDNTLEEDESLSQYLITEDFEEVATY